MTARNVTLPYRARRRRQFASAVHRIALGVFLLFVLVILAAAAA